MFSIHDTIKSIAELVDDRAEWELLRSPECGLPRECFVAQPMESAQPLERARARWQSTP